VSAAVAEDEGRAQASLWSLPSAHVKRERRGNVAPVVQLSVFRADGFLCRFCVRFGSLCIGDFDAGSSDIDFLAIVDGPLRDAPAVSRAGQP
jgi:hypothetical protein